VAPMDAEAAYKGLLYLTKRIADNDYPLKEWEEYSRINSNEMLDLRFREVLSLTDK